MRLSLKSNALENSLLFSVVSHTEKSDSGLLASRPDYFNHLIFITAHWSANEDRSYFADRSFRLGFILSLFLLLFARVRVQLRITFLVTFFSFLLLVTRLNFLFNDYLFNRLEVSDFLHVSIEVE